MSSKLQCMSVRLWAQLVVVPSGERLWVEAGMMVFAGKTVRSMLVRLRGSTTRRYINPSYLYLPTGFSGKTSLSDWTTHEDRNLWWWQYWVVIFKTKTVTVPIKTKKFGGSSEAHVVWTYHLPVRLHRICMDTPARAVLPKCPIEIWREEDYAKSKVDCVGFYCVLSRQSWAQLS